MTAARSLTAAEPTGTPLWEFHAEALGRPVHVAVIGGDAGVLEDARDRLAELDGLWGAGDRHGDLARLERWPGVVQHVAPETVLLVAIAVDAAEAATDRPLDDVVIDVRHGQVGVPGAADLGLAALAPALAADLVAADLVDAGVAGVLVTVGDCSRAEGAAPDRDGWIVPIAGEERRLRRGGLVATAGAVVAADEAWRAHVAP
jgi:hypothetical protein